MRLTSEQRRIVREQTVHVFGDDARVKLFGSRLDDSARGGDIDLLVEVPQVTEAHRRSSLRLIARLQQRLGDQPIDVLVAGPATDTAVHTEARRAGIVL